MLFQLPSPAQQPYAGPGPVSTISTVVEWTSVLFFYISVVYFGASVALTLGRDFAFGLINLAVSLCAAGFMFIEPMFFHMVSATGLQYSVKFTIQMALCSVCVLAALSLLLLPSILAFAKSSKWRLHILPLNLTGVFVFPVFIFALYIVQSEIASSSADKLKGEAEVDNVESKSNKADIVEEASDRQEADLAQSDNQKNQEE